MRSVVVSILFLFCLVCTLEAAPPKAWDGWVFDDYVRNESDEFLPGTSLLTWKQDYSVVMNAGIDRFLLEQTQKVRDLRTRRWNHGATTRQDYDRFLSAKREKLGQILGLVEPRVSGPFLFADTTFDKVPGQQYTIRSVCWRVFDDYLAEGVFVAPLEKNPTKLVIAVPHCGMEPLAYFKSVPYLTQLANKGECAIVVVATVGRQPRRLANRPVDYPAREALFQSAWEVGRHVIGYEIETVRALIDSWQFSCGEEQSQIELGGYGDGGMIALYTAALDTRINSVQVAGYFDKRESMWKQPMDRNVFGLLNDFGDAELAAMVFPRKVLIESGAGPEEVIVPPSSKALRPESGDKPQIPVKYTQSRWAPAVLESPQIADVLEEIDRARKIVASLAQDNHWIVFLPEAKNTAASSFAPAKGSKFEMNAVYLASQDRIFKQLDNHTQTVLANSWKTRAQFMSKLDYKSLAAYEKSTQWYRDYFYNNVIGKFELKPLPFNPRSRKAFDAKTWVGYDVVLDVFEHVCAQGLLAMPRTLIPGKKYPVVVYQHGLEGRPEGAILRRGHNQILVRLVERGYIVFAPQDIYAGGDSFRTLQRKSRPLGKTLYSITIPQHQQITDWLGTLPFVDKSRIGFYGISYGGKTAMRVPAVVTNYALSICSGDFSDWVYRVASSREPFSYIGTSEYEIPEFNLGGTFNYAEMTSLIAPRPFMVERGHFDGCGRDEHIAFEYAKVRFLYEAKLGISERTAIEWFVGGHEIHAGKSVEFLDRWLK